MTVELAKQALADATRWPTKWCADFNVDELGDGMDYFRCWASDDKDGATQEMALGSEDYDRPLADYIATMNTREPLLARAVLDQAKEIERLNADVERYRTQLTVERGNHGNTRDELEAMTAARDEACDIAMARELPECPPEIDATMERVRVLRSVGAKP